MSARGTGRRGWHLPVVALVLALALPAVPIARSVGAACERCPAGCPMHAKKKRLGCHGASRANEAAPCARAPAVGSPGCGFTGNAALGWMAPALLPPPAVFWAPATEPAPRASTPRPPARGADPPELPPPISLG